MRCKTTMYFALVVLNISCTSCTNCVTNKTSVTYLENQHIKIGLLPSAGGRMVFFGKSKGENMLLSDKNLWGVQIDKPFNQLEYIPYNGMITWVGPQSDWWTQQEIYTQRKENAAIWPPDPYTEYGKYKISEKSKIHLVLTGEKSPVTGLAKTKSFTLEDSILFISVNAENQRDSNVYWDLWSNARFPATTDFFVPIKELENIKILTTPSEHHESVPHITKEGIFRFIYQKPSKISRKRTSKAYIFPSKGHIGVFTQNKMLIMEFEKLQRDQIHPNQALVEIYNSISSCGQDDVLELEHHSAYQTIAPGQSISLSEKWYIIDLPDGANLDKCIEVYKSIWP